MKTKAAKNIIITAAVILCVLAAAWFYGGNYTEKASVPEGTPVVGTETAKPGPEKDAFSAASALLPQAIAPSGSETPYRRVKEDRAEAAEPEEPAEITAAEAIQGQIAGNEEKPESGADASAISKAESKDAVSNITNDNPSSPTETEPQTGKDKYLTDPVPKGRPAPVEWQDVAVNEEVELTCTLSVSCMTIFDNLDRFNKDKLEVLPADGMIYPPRTVVFYEGESVFDVLLREMKKHKIHMEFSMVPLYNSHYIKGINNIYEFDCGELSGWMYKVNGWFPNYGASRYLVQDGDVIEWVYTCDLGRDVGAEWLGGSGG